MPSGREIHSTKPYVPSALDADTLAQMRAPPDPDGDPDPEEASSSGDEDGKQQGTLPGAFPSSSNLVSSESYY